MGQLDAQIFLLFLVITSVKTKLNIKDIVKEINQNLQIELNVFINFDQPIKPTEQYEDLLQLQEVPKLIITDIAENFTALHKVFTQQCFTIAWISKTTLELTLNFMDRLLWTIHFKDILLIYQMENTTLGEGDLLEIFSLCLAKGYVSLLLRHDNQLYTYHPYPDINVKQINSLQEYQDKSHLLNFQGKVMNVPFFEFPPVCFSYTNYKGELLRVGFKYTFIETFFTHCNASYDHQFHDLWAYNVSYSAAFETVTSMNFSFIPILMPPLDIFARSRVMMLTRTVLIVPTPREIFTGLYVIIPFNILVWFIVFLTGIFYFLLVNMISYLTYKNFYFGQAFQDAFSIIVFLSVSRRVTVKTYANKFNLILLFLFTGIFLTNYYSSSLSSLYTSKVYEPDMFYIDDIASNNLKIFEYSADAPLWAQRNMSSLFLERIITNTNDVFFHNRQILNMSYMYTATEEYADFLLFRQTYLNHPKAKKLNEPLFTRPVLFTFPHRSTYIEQFDRYILYAFDSGIFNKILSDVKWHGILSGRLKFFLDEEENKSLTLEYFHYVFIIWLMGLICGFISFLCEIFKEK